MEDKEDKKKVKFNFKIIIVMIAVICIIVAVCMLSKFKKEEITETSFHNHEYAENNTNEDDDEMTLKKPIIYLYPTKETNVSVKLLRKEKILCSYPKYNNGWNVIASPEGNLKDIKTGRNLYSLYYESENIHDFKIETEGFIVKSEDVSQFLEEKLSILGLTEKETEEFIIYWLPKLESNKYNYIRFATKNEIDENMPVEISPKPDTFIRVLMTFKGLEEPLNITEQKLIKQERRGFVAVEWGGTEIK